MGMAMGVLFLWLGAACLWVASHGITTNKPDDHVGPWDVFKHITDGLRNG